MEDLGDGWKHLQSARLDLRAVTADDAPEMAALFASPALYEYTGGETPTVDWLRQDYAQKADGRSPDGRDWWLNWVLRRRSDATAVGIVQATIVGAGQLAEVAWIVGVDYQGQGFATEAARTVVEWLFAEGVRAVQAHIHPEHRRSERVAVRAGLEVTKDVQDGERRWIAHAPRHGTDESG